MQLEANQAQHVRIERKKSSMARFEIKPVLNPRLELE